MAIDTSDWASPGTGWLSVSDQQYYSALLDHARRQVTPRADTEYFHDVGGHVHYRTTFAEPALQWQQASGTIATDATRFLIGSQSLKLTTAGGAGVLAIARKNFPLAADQSVNANPLIVVSGFFQFRDVHTRSIEMFVRPDDSVDKFEGAVRFHYQTAGVSSMQVETLAPDGSFTPRGGYVIAPPLGQVLDEWHWFVCGLAYKQGQFLRYAKVLFDDFDFTPGAPLPDAHPVASAGVRQTNCDIIVEGDDASATSVNVGAWMLSDLSGLFQY